MLIVDGDLSQAENLIRGREFNDLTIVSECKAQLLLQFS